MKPPPNPCPEIRTSIQYIDPAFASRLLATNQEHQRSISRTNLQKIENSLREEKFYFNGQTIIVSDRPKLLDGQHRLQAVVNTGIGFWTVYVSNVPEEYFKFMDCGRSRSFSDVLKTTGRASQTNLAAATTRLAEYLKDPSLVGSNIPFSHAELIDVIEMAPDLENSVRAVMACKHILPPSQTAWLHYLLSQECPEQCDTFFASLGSGEMLPKTSPIFLLRTRIINDKARGFHAGLKEACALLVKAWNGYVTGKAPTKFLAWRVGEKFPSIIIPTKKQIALAGA